MTSPEADIADRLTARAEAVAKDRGVPLSTEAKDAMKQAAREFWPGRRLPPEIGEKRGLEAIKAASAYCGQFITLSSALLALSISFASNFGPKANGLALLTTRLGVAWLCLFGAVIFGLCCVSRIIASLDAADRNPAHQADPYAQGIRPLGLLMVACFGLGLVMLCAAMLSAGQ